MPDLGTHSATRHTSLDHRLLRQLWAAGCKEISLTVRDKDAAVSLRQDLNEFREQMRANGTMPLGAVDNAKISVIWRSADGREHSYANDTTTPPPPEDQVKAWQVKVRLDFTGDFQAWTAELLK
jgi:hypothetical protein